MRIALTLVFLATIASCASESTSGSDALVGKVQEREIVSTMTERSASRPQLPIRERSLSSQSLQETVFKPVYEHVVALKDGRTIRVRTTNPGYPAGSCVRVSAPSGAEQARLSADSGCR